MLKIQDESESSSEGAVLRYVMNRNRQMRGGGVFKIQIYDEPEAPYEGVC